MTDSPQRYEPQPTYHRLGEWLVVALLVAVLAAMLAGLDLAAAGRLT